MDRTVTKLFLAGAFLFMAAGVAEAQTRGLKKGRPIEAGIMLGASNYMGELSKSVAFNETHPMGGLICRFNPGSAISLRASALFGRISGTDENYGDDAFRKRRNLSFRSNVVEFSGQIEWNISGYEESQRTQSASPYLFLGIGVFKFNPLARFNYVASVHDASLAGYDDQWIELQPLATEGQETTKYNDKRRYSLTQISIPFGAGYKRQFGEVWAWGVELGLRKTFTDYLDDISTIYVDDQIVGGNNGYLAAAMKDRSREIGQEPFANNDLRGNSSTKDWYFFFGFTLTRKITGGKTICFQF